MTSPNPAPDLIRFLSMATVIGEIHGISVETVLIHWLALASMVVGDLVDSRPDPSKGVIKAKIPLLMVTYDSAPPRWIASAVRVMCEAQDSVLRSKFPRISIEEAVTKQKEEMKALIALGHRAHKSGSDDMPDPELFMIEQQIRITQNRQYFRHLHLVGSRVPLQAPSEGFTCGIVADGLRSYLRILGTRHLDHGLAASLNREPAIGSNLIGWLCERDLQRLANHAGSWFSRLGWIITAPAADGTKKEAKLPVPVGEFLPRLANMRLSAKPFSFSPQPAARDFLDRQVEEVRILTGLLPSEQRLLAVPDPHLAWHLSAMLAVIAGETLRPDLTLLLCCRLGSFLASRIVRHHIGRWSRLFPTDAHGAFTGLDLNIVRFLTNEPQSVREFQRRLRGVSKSRCLVTLHRACDAGLAVTLDGKRFQVTPDPPPGLGMSEFLSEMDAETAFPVKLCSKSTDRTDMSMRKPVSKKSQEPSHARRLEGKSPPYCGGETNSTARPHPVK